MLNLEMIPRLRQDVIYRENDWVIFDTGNGKLIELNDSANDILKAMGEGKTVSHIIDEMVELYIDSNYDEIKDFVCDYINELIENNLVESR